MRKYHLRHQKLKSPLFVTKPKLAGSVCATCGPGTSAYSWRPLEEKLM